MHNFKKEEILRFMSFHSWIKESYARLTYGIGLNVSDRSTFAPRGFVCACAFATTYVCAHSSNIGFTPYGLLAVFDARRLNEIVDQKTCLVYLTLQE